MDEEKPKRKKRVKLTNRERRFFKALAQGKTQKEAALAAGYSPNNPRQSATQVMHSIENKAPDLFARHGLDDDSFIGNYLLPALNANETKFFAHEGRVIDQREVIAWGPRTNTNQLVARMKGMVVENREAPSTNIGIKILLVPTEMRPRSQVRLKDAANTSSS